jgi:single-stranded DNA-specific DHH superfamily exonuclease
MPKITAKQFSELLINSTLDQEQIDIIVQKLDTLDEEQIDQIADILREDVQEKKKIEKKAELNEEMILHQFENKLESALNE